MIYADLTYEEHYSDMHDRLVDHLSKHFTNIQHGHQGDSWIWIFSDGDSADDISHAAEDMKVAIDTFSAMVHQVKSSNAPDLARRVIAVLSQSFELSVYDNPELEPHED